MVLGYTKRQRNILKHTAVRQAVEALETRRLLAVTLFSANFEDVSGTGGFTIDSPATNLWHSSTLASQSPTHSMYYGIDATANYNTVDAGGNPTANAGTITSPVINLAGHAAADLRFRSFLYTENSVLGPNPDFPVDIAKVQVSTNAGATWTDLASNQNGTLTDAYGWNVFSTSLNSYAGNPNVQIRFSFNTTDAWANEYVGWFVDDVVVSDPQGNPAPEITAVTPAYGTVINTTSTTIGVTFSEAVTGVDASSLVLSGAGNTAVVGTPTQNGNTYSFPVSGLQTGTLNVVVAGNGNIKDSANQVVLPVATKYAVLLPDRFETNNTFAAATNLGDVGGTHAESGLSIDSPSDVDYFKFTPDADGTVTISTKGNTSLGELALYVYDSTQTQVASDDGTASPVADTRTVTLANAKAGQTYYIQVNGFSRDPGTGLSSDFANDYALTVTAPFQAPTVASIVTTPPTLTNATSLVYTVNFSESVTGVDAGDFSVATSGTATGVIASVTQVNPSQYTVTVTSGGDGTVGLNLVDNDTIHDLAGIALGGSGTGNGNFTGPTYTVDHTAPTLQSFQVNDGTAQRSKVGSVTVVFSEQVTLSGTPFVLRMHNLTPTATTLTVTNPLGDLKTYVITFSGTGTTGGSVDDGVYDLVVNGSSVADAASNVVAGTPFQSFHRLFGDQDGDRDVDNLDFIQFRAALNRPAGYRSYFDYTGNSNVDNLDFIQFRARLNRIVYPAY